MKVFLDTHAAVAVAGREPGVFGPAARKALQASERLISGAVILELAYLHEVGKLLEPAREVRADLARTWDVQASADTLRDLADAAVDLDWTRDPFDRLIVANAMLHDAPLVTRDRQIHEHYPKAVW